MSSNKYFAVDKAEECVGYLESAAENWYNSIQRNNYLEKMIRSWSYYYGDFYDAAHEITFSGESGELVNMPIGHYRNIAQHILINITSSRPAFQCRAINEDRKSMIQATLGNGILQYYMREKRYERKLRKAAEYAVVMGTGYILTEWNSTKGGVSGELEINQDLIYSYDENENPLDENGEILEATPIFRGDIESRVLSPLDVVFDFTKDDPEMNDWYLVRIFANKYDLAAKYPEMKDDILRIETKGSNSKRVCLSPYNETTDIPLYAFFHRSTESTPKGRYILYANKDTILEDTGLPYTSLPIQRIAPSDILGSSFGYTPMFDLLPIQDAINSVYSTVLTNHNAFGVQNIVNPMGNNVKFTQVSDGLNWIEYDKEFGAPAPLQLTKSSPESFNLIGMLEKVMETISGINSVSRGNPEASLKSGTALALIQAQALTFMSGLQQSYIQLLEDSATFIIDLLKEFGDQPRTIAIAGISNIQKMKQFNNDDLQSISRVAVDVGNSMMHCLAKDTKVLMHDGSTKMSQDIEVGDLVMGDDSLPRTVNASGTGKEEMFEIRSNDTKELVYTCNKSHIMSLRYCSSDSRYNVKKGDIIDISVANYLELPKRQKRILMGFRKAVEFDKKELSIDPYIFGTWIGDGNSANPGITTIDFEIKDSWENYSKILGLEFFETKQPEGKAPIYHISSRIQNGSNDRNEFTNRLRSLNVLNNKFIPNDYLTSSTEDRLSLLAGLIDTDGTLTGDSTFVFYQKDNNISEAVVYLCKSLGLRVTSRKETRVCSFNNKISEYNILVIGGDTWRVPTRIKRKQVKEKLKIKNWLNYGIELVSIGEGNYYGFTLLEEPHFLLGDFTVTHNTAAGRWQVAENLSQMGLITTPEHFLEILNTGSLSAATSGLTNELDVIRAENEALLYGNPIIAISIDKHAMHIREHRDVLSDPNSRFDVDLVERTLAHIQEHITLMRETDPALLAIYGEQPVGPVAGSPPAPQGAPNPTTGGDMGETMQEGEFQQPSTVAKPAQPPAPFQNMPQTPQDLMQQQGG